MKKLFSILITFLIAIDLYIVFFYAPVDSAQGMVQKIFYWHVGSAFTMFAAFTACGVFALLYLIKKNPVFDKWGVSLAEVGFLFCTIVLITGPIWAKPTWGVWWTWEPRLTSTLFMWLIFVSYFILRGSFNDPAKKRTYSAALAVFACIDIPIIFYSVKLWRGAHPAVLGSKSNMPPEMWVAFGLTVFTVLALGSLLTVVRTGKEK